MRRALLPFVIAVILLLPFTATAQGPLVRAVFFFSPTCPHCEKVISQDVPPLEQQYGDQLQLLYVDVTTEVGQALYQSAIRALAIPQNRLGVPTLVVGETVLVGSLEIPQQFPGIIEQVLAQGGVEWPRIPGLPEVLASVEASGQPEAEAITGAGSGRWTDRIARDPVGNSLALLVLAALAASSALALNQWRRGAETDQGSRPSWRPRLMMSLIVAGGLISAYLSLVETSSVEAVCGPIGDCVAVNNSRYARLFGTIPVGLLGLLGYILIGLAWILEYSSQGSRRWWAAAALGVLTAFGYLFSLYLTFLEPFVIGATCAWCVTSAIIMTALFVLSAGPARLAYQSLRRI